MNALDYARLELERRKVPKKSDMKREKQEERRNFLQKNVDRVLAQFQGINDLKFSSAWTLKNSNGRIQCLVAYFSTFEKVLQCFNEPFVWWRGGQFLSGDFEIVWKAEMNTGWFGEVRKGIARDIETFEKNFGQDMAFFIDNH